MKLWQKFYIDNRLMQLYISYVSSKAERQTYVSPSTATICTINTTLLILIRRRNCPLHLYASASFHFSNPPQHCLIISPSPSSTLSTSPACHFHVAPSPLHPCHISSSHEDLTMGKEFHNDAAQGHCHQWVTGTWATNQGEAKAT